MKRIVAMCITVFLVIPLAGCWDAKEIQDINYISAIGVDYREGQYTVYLQILDFSHVAKGESMKPSEEASVWVGKGTGLTVNEAVNQLYETSQQRVFWGHVTAIVFSESVLKEGLLGIMDLTNRYREIRYTKWVYGTKEDIESVFSTTPFFKLSPLSSILHSPKDIYKQQSFIEPIQFHLFAARYNEPGSTVVLPCLSVDRRAWKESGEEHAMLKTDSAFLLRGKRVEWIDEGSLRGIRWMNAESVRNSLTLRSDGKPLASVIAYSPKIDIDFEQSSGQFAFTATVHIDIILNSILETMSEEEIERKTSEEIEREILETFRAGIERQSDVFSLGNVVYKKKPSVYHQYWDSETLPIRSSSLKKIDVKVNLKNSGKYKQYLHAPK
jgi:Ger(x)C family germination protein